MLSLDATLELPDSEDDHAVVALWDASCYELRHSKSGDGETPKLPERREYYYVLLVRHLFTRDESFVTTIRVAARSVASRNK